MPLKECTCCSNIDIILIRVNNHRVDCCVSAYTLLVEIKSFWSISSGEIVRVKGWGKHWQMYILQQATICAQVVQEPFRGPVCPSGESLCWQWPYKKCAAHRSLRFSWLMTSFAETARWMLTWSWVQFQKHNEATVFELITIRNSTTTQRKHNE